MRRTWIVTGVLSFVGCSPNSEPPKISVAPQVQPTLVAQSTPVVSAPIVITPRPLSVPTTVSEPSKPARTTIVKGADPEADVEKAWRAGDHRFAALNSNGLYLPGAENGMFPVIVKRYGLKTICEMSDVNRTEEQNQQWQLSINYATRYNRLLLAKLQGA